MSFQNKEATHISAQGASDAVQYPSTPPFHSYTSPDFLVPLSTRSSLRTEKRNAEGSSKALRVYNMIKQLYSLPKHDRSRDWCQLAPTDRVLIRKVLSIKSKKQQGNAESWCQRQNQHDIDCAPQTQLVVSAWVGGLESGQGSSAQAMTPSSLDEALQVSYLHMYKPLQLDKSACGFHAL